MSKNNQNTEDILDAIRNMMTGSSVNYNQELPKDVVELTNPVDEDIKEKKETIDILELSNPISDEKYTKIVNKPSIYQEKNESIINDAQIREAVRKAIHSLPSSKLDEIINEELTKIIQERLNSSKIIISSENKKN